jgi:hypothetical protein
MSVDALKNLKNLRSLNLSYCRSLSSDGLKNLTNLQSLALLPHLVEECRCTQGTQKLPKCRNGETSADSLDPLRLSFAPASFQKLAEKWPSHSNNTLWGYEVSRSR